MFIHYEEVLTMSMSQDQIQDEKNTHQVMDGKNAYQVADYIFRQTDKNLTSLHINKLVFFAHGWNLGIYKKPLIDERIEAWTWGPVIPSIYHAFKIFGSDPIELDPIVKNDDSMFSDKEKEVMSAIAKIYSKMSVDELISITHQNGSPWEKTYEPGVLFKKIPDDIIQNYYAEQYDQGKRK